MAKKIWSAKAPLLDLPKDVEALVLDNLANYRGPGTTLESALGALIIGRHYGWRVLRMMHSPSTYSKYEKLLGVEFKTVCPEDTDLSQRSIGMRVAVKLKSFWAVVMGREKVDNKGVLEDE